jgi:hypothetical protein
MSWGGGVLCNAGASQWLYARVSGCMRATAKDAKRELLLDADLSDGLIQNRHIERKKEVKKAKRLRKEKGNGKS